MSAHTTDEPDVLLKMRTLRLLFGDGRMAELRSVLCPAQQVLALEHRLSCEDSGGLVQSEADAEYASCRAARAMDTGPLTGAAKPRARAAATSLSELMTGRLRGSPGRAEAPRGPTAADAMTRGAFILPENALVPQSAALMNRRGVHRVIIVSDDGRVAGIVTSSDIVRWLAEQAATAADE